MKVVLDTNVIVSGFLIWGGPPARLIGLWAEGRITVVVSRAAHRGVPWRPRTAELCQGLDRLKKGCSCWKS